MKAGTQTPIPDPHLIRNGLLQVISGTLTKIGDELASAKVVLPWLLTTLGAPVAMVGWLVPIRESLSMIPQLALTGFVRARRARKWVFVAGCLAQGAAVAGMAATAWLLSGVTAGFMILGLLVVFSLSRALCSIASKDVLGKTIPKGRRGRLLGYRSTVAGIFTIGVGLSLQTRLGQDDSFIVYGGLLILAASLWLLGALTFSLVREEPGAATDGVRFVESIRGGMTLMREDVALRRFVFARTLMISTALVAPFYVSLARQHAAGGAGTLGLLMIASGLAGSLSATIWGGWADRASHRVLGTAGAMAALNGFSIAWIARVWPDVLTHSLTHAAFFMVLGIAHSGVRLGRKTYIVDLATAENRSTYVAVSNTIIGLILLASGIAALPADQVGPAGMIALLAGLSAVASWRAFHLEPTG